MRMDHYIKIGDNDIHAVQLVYSISAIIVLLLLSTVVIHRSVLRDLKSIELTALGRKHARDKKRAGGHSVASGEDEMGLTGGQKPQPENIAWKKI
jgi:hypothetical protein